MNAFMFRFEGVTHIVMTTKNRVRRNGMAHTMCAVPVTQAFQHIDAPRVPIRCDRCQRAFDGFVDMTGEYGDEAKVPIEDRIAAARNHAKKKGQ